jgi:hypothetical protein
MIPLNSYFNLEQWTGNFYSEYVSANKKGMIANLNTDKKVGTH